MVFNGAVMYSFPPFPPLPVIVTPFKAAVPPKELIPARLVVTLNGMLAMGTSPIGVRAVTSADPDNPKLAVLVSVTAWNSCWNAALLVEVRGWSWNERTRFASFPVETPPFAGAFATSNYYGTDQLVFRGSRYRASLP